MKRKLLYLIFLAFYGNAQAQIFNGHSIFVGDNVTMISELSIQNPGLLINRGEIVMQANWQSSGIYQGPGILELQGSGPQVFQHNGNAINLIKINSAGDVLQKGKVVVGKQINFISGRWITSDSDTLLISENANAIGGNTNSFVNGPLHQSGIGLRFFPIGNGNIYLPMTLENISGSNPVLNGQVRENLPDIIPSIVSNTVYRDFYWEVDAYKPAFTGSPMTFSFPPDILRSTHIGLLYAPDLAAEEFKFVPATLSESGRWILSSLNSLGAGYFVLAEKPEATADENAFYFPNTLAPNAYGEENQALKIFGDLMSEDFQFTVFNRLGHIVYETNDISLLKETGWTGISNDGKPLPAGSYPYYLQARSSMGEKIQQKGFLTILK